MLHFFTICMCWQINEEIYNIYLNYDMMATNYNTLSDCKCPIYLTLPNRTKKKINETET